MKSAMSIKSVFISFDYEHDKDIRGSLVAQAKDPHSPFNITDWSVNEPIDEKWRQKVRDIIHRTDLTIVICGEFTDTAAGVTAEMTIVREEKKPYFLLRGRRKKVCKKPGGTLRTDEIQPWNWQILKRLISEVK